MQYKFLYFLSLLTVSLSISVDATNNGDESFYPPAKKQRRQEQPPASSSSSSSTSSTSTQTQNTWVEPLALIEVPVSGTTRPTLAPVSSQLPPVIAGTTAFASRADKDTLRYLWYNRLSPSQREEIVNVLDEARKKLLPRGFTASDILKALNVRLKLLLKEIIQPAKKQELSLTAEDLINPAVILVLTDVAPTITNLTIKRSTEPNPALPSHQIAYVLAILFPNVTTLSLANSGLELETIETILHSLKNVTSLNLAGNLLEESGLAALLLTPYAADLEYLDLRNTGISRAMFDLVGSVFSTLAPQNVLLD